MEQFVPQASQINDKDDPRCEVTPTQVVTKAKSSPRGISAPRERDKLPLKTRLVVLTEAGYRCGVPTCRNILALDIHHIWEVSAGGSDDPTNLIALCPTCHVLYHRGTIKQESIFVYKSMLVAITRAFDVEAIDRLLFLELFKKDRIVVSGDGLLHFARLVAAGFSSAEQKANNNWQLVTYAVNLTDKGRQLITAWKAGDRSQLAEAMGGPIPGGTARIAAAQSSKPRKPARQRKKVR